MSVRSVDFELTEENIKQFLRGKRAYVRTEFFVFSFGGEWAVASVDKKEENSVLQPIESVEVLSLPGETEYVENPSLEVLSASAMGALAESVGAKCVVVKGKSEHVSFFLSEQPRDIVVFDVVPPSPSKLVGLVETVLETEMQDTYVRYTVQEVNLNDLASAAGTPAVMFPCRASGLKAGNCTTYLDETAEMDYERVKNLTLVGCSLSARIFRAIYGRDPPLVNMCPWDMAKESNVSGKMLVKCCKVREGYELDGDIAIVPWGARASDVSRALKALLS